MELCSVLFILLSLGLKIEAQRYLALMPNTIESQRDFTISVHILEPLTQPETVTAQLFDRTGKIIVEDAGQAIADNPDVILKLKVPYLPSWGYTLSVFGTGAFHFRNATYISVRRKSIPVFVQTDKAVYKPGDKIQFAVFAISENLDEIHMTFTLNIFNAEGNKISEHTDVTADPLYEGSLLLSTLTSLGQWRFQVIPKAFTIKKTCKTETILDETIIPKITNKTDQCESKPTPTATENCYEDLLKLIEDNVDVSTTMEKDEIVTDENVFGRAETNYYVEVLEYVLPEFEVTLEISSVAVIGDPGLNGILRARYANGKPVKGYAEVTVSKRWYYYGYNLFFEPKAIRINQMITGDWEFSIPKEVLDRLIPCSQQTTLTVQASVTETLTGIKLEANPVQVTFYVSRYRLAFHQSMPSSFKPGFTYPVMLTVSQQDGSPATDVNGEVVVTTTFFTRDATNETVQHQTDYPGYTVESPYSQGETIMIKPLKQKIKNSAIYIKDILVPKSAETGRIQAEFEGLCIYKDISRFTTLNNVFLQVEAVEVGTLEINSRLLIRLKCSVENINGYYLIISKYKIVEYGFFYIDENRIASIAILLTRSMAPSARFVAYAVYKGEVLADGIVFGIEDIYENKVSVLFDPQGPIQPKSEVQLKLKADPGSVASLLLVDKRVRLLKDGNDITPERVEAALGLYSGVPIFHSSWGRYWPWTLNVDDTRAILQEAGLFALTDAIVYDKPLEKISLPIPIPIPDLEAPEMAEDQLRENEGTIQPIGQVRQNFPETWEWRMARVGASGEVNISLTVPDTITTWVANAFAVNTKSGFGVTPELANLTGYLPFYVRMDLPYSAIQGELLILQAIVFNDYDTDLKVLVTLFNVGDFQGIELSDNGTEQVITGHLARCVLVKAKSATPVFFHVKPSVIGSMKINVRIEADNIYDEIIIYLLIKAEGEEMAINTPVLISHQTVDTTLKSVSITYPDDTVPGSERMQFSVYGHLFAPTINNIGRLIRMPYGCGEQNMINFVPTIHAARYMIATNTMTPAMKKKIEEIILIGYQRELLYRRIDGSFSAFGNADRYGSTWLTAYVVKSFSEASTLISIDVDMLEGSISYIIGQQTVDGDYINIDKALLHKAMQGGTAGSKASLTAYIASALRAVKSSGILQGRDTGKIDASILLAISYLNNNLPTPIPDYLAALGAFVDPKKQIFLAALQNSENRTERETDGAVYWKNTKSRAVEIETTSYALLVYTCLNDINTAMSILKWLVEQMNPWGGFMSTQDTVIGVQALQELAVLLYSPEKDMDIMMSAFKNGNLIIQKSFALSGENQDIYQYADIDGQVDSIEITATGIGLALFEIHQFFNVFVEPVKPSYFLSIDSHDESTKGYELTVCTRYLVENQNSGMVIMGVKAISGFKPLKDGINHVLIKRTETDRDVLNIYFSEIPNRENVCVIVKFRFQFPVAGVKMATVRVYSYYETGESVMESYIPDILKNENICEVCGEECGCGVNALVLPLNECQ